MEFNCEHFRAMIFYYFKINCLFSELQFDRYENREARPSTNVISKNINAVY